MEIRPLDQSEYDAAADIYADAFLDDPGSPPLTNERSRRRCLPPSPPALCPRPRGLRSPM